MVALPAPMLPLALGLLAVLLAPAADAADNGVARLPPMGYNQWNFFHNNFNVRPCTHCNSSCSTSADGTETPARLAAALQTLPQASLFLETSKFMKDQGFLDAGYNYMTLGGIGYANGSTCQPVSACNITRNSTGFLQVDPKRFPGGNDGFTAMVDKIRAMGFKWGSYTEAGTSGCNGAKGSSEGYEEQDAKLFVEEWNR
jgi:alpha-galactosidase